MLKGLNQEQKAAVEHFGSPLLLLAGAGSGKTKVLTHKIGYLIKEKGIKPHRILAITFTKKAAQEMAGRVERMLTVKPRSISPPARGLACFSRQGNRLLFSCISYLLTV
jgi:DNA helicase-2/ATP-dependent DNA helicase PcrA